MKPMHKTLYMGYIITITHIADNNTYTLTVNDKHEKPAYLEHAIDESNLKFETMNAKLFIIELDRKVSNAFA